jgi:hypothetical protein
MPEIDELLLASVGVGKQVNILRPQVPEVGSA